MTNQQQLVETVNNAEVIGVLVENKLVQKTTRKGVPYIGGSIKVRVGEDNDIYVSVFEQKSFSSGKENPAYAGLETVMKTKVSMADIVEKDLKDVKPSYVRCSGGGLEVNTYFNQKTKQVVSQPQITARYISEVKPDENGNYPQPKATFFGDGIINKIMYKEAIDENSPSKVELEVLAVNFAGVASPLPFVVYGNGADYIQGNLSKGDAIEFNGVMRNIFKEEKRVTEMTEGFGEPTIEIKRTAVREWEIRGAQTLRRPHNYDDAELLRAGIAKHEVRLAELKAEGENNAQAQPVPKKDEGFNFGDALEQVSEEVDMSSLFNM